MIGIYIRGMEIPTKEYGKMVVTIYPSGHVVEYLGDMGRDFGTAIPVPPHGRLGDLDVLYEKFARLENEAMSALKTTNAGSPDWIKWSAILTERTGYKFDIADAPTIIPADRKKEE